MEGSFNLSWGLSQLGQGAGSKEQSVQTSSTLESLKPKGEFAVKEGAIKEKAERILRGVYQYQLPKSFNVSLQLLAKKINRATALVSQNHICHWSFMIINVSHNPQ